jgi:hypothetical protein
MAGGCSTTASRSTAAGWPKDRSSSSGRAPTTGVSFRLRFGHWKGARVGIFCYGRDGHVDIDSVRYIYSDRPGNGIRNASYLTGPLP